MTKHTATEILDRSIVRAGVVVANRAAGREKIAEKIAGDFILTSFDYDGLIEGDALATVWVSIKDSIIAARGEADFEGDEALLAYIERMVASRALMFRTPGSSSASSNQIDTAAHVAWLEAYNYFAAAR